MPGRIQTGIQPFRQHRAILKVLLKEDWRAARKAMVFHIRNNHVVLKSIAPESISVTGQNKNVKLHFRLIGEKIETDSKTGKIN